MKDIYEIYKIFTMILKNSCYHSIINNNTIEMYK